MSTGKICIAFLDVGQGDSTVITLPDQSSALVVDCPSKRSGTTMEHLQERSITTLSYLFVTHTDDDHLGGAVTLLDNFVHFGEVGTVAYNHDTHRISSGKRRAALQRLVQLARLHDLQIHNPRAGDGWEIQDLIIDVLHPAAIDLNDAQLRANPNNASIVLKLTYAAKSILLPADLQGLESRSRSS